MRLHLIREKKTPEFTLYPLAHRGKIMWGHREGSHLQAKKRGLTRSQDCWLLDLGCWIKFCCLSSSVCGILLWQPELTTYLCGSKKLCSVNKLCDKLYLLRQNDQMWLISSSRLISWAKIRQTLPGPAYLLMSVLGPQSTWGS